MTGFGSFHNGMWKTVLVN